MSKEKLTDEQIIKALECYAESIPCREECEIFELSGKDTCYIFIAKQSLNLINRLKEEKEDLRLDKWELMNTISEKDNRIALLEDNNAELKAENERLRRKG